MRIQEKNDSGKFFFEPFIRAIGYQMDLQRTHTDKHISNVIEIFNLYMEEKKLSYKNLVI